jgi:hypothetical protein
VLYLAQHHPKPKGDSENATGLWSPRRYFYGFYHDGLWAKSPLHFKPSVTPSEDSRVTKVSLRSDFCACPECAVPRSNYSACK